MILGEAALAFLKTSLTARSESPTYLLKSCYRGTSKKETRIETEVSLTESARAHLSQRSVSKSLTSPPLTAMKFKPLSVAIALAIKVLEQPGGP